MKNKWDFDISFGICLGENADIELVNSIAESIFKQQIPNFEIWFIGDKKHRQNWSLLGKNLNYIDFNEDAHPEGKKGWITKKKNVLVEIANNPTVVLIHDYLTFDDGWYEGWKEFGKSYNDYKAPALYMNRVLTKEGTRSADWLIAPWAMDLFLDEYRDAKDILMAAAPHENHPKYVCGLPYDENRFTEWQYISGGFIMGDREFLRWHPQWERLVWGEAEDVVWSKNVLSIAPFTDKYKYIMNPLSSITIQKPNKWTVTEMPKEALDLFTRWANDAI